MGGYAVSPVTDDESGGGESLTRGKGKQPNEFGWKRDQRLRAARKARKEQLPRNSELTGEELREKFVGLREDFYRRNPTDGER